MKAPHACTAVCCASLALTGAASGGFIDLQVESYIGEGWAANGFSGLTAWRVYCLFEDPSEGVVAMFGSPANPAWVQSTSGTFHNDAFFDSLTAPVNYTGSPFFYWANQWDTYVTIGTTDNAGDATGLTPNFDAEVGGLAGDFTTDNASWYITPVDPQGLGTQVLIAQFVVAEGEHVWGVLNVHDYTGASYLDVEFTSIPAPGALALIGLGILAGRRRRRV